MLLDDGPDGAHYLPLQTQIVLEVLSQLVELKGTLRRQSLKFGNVLLVPIASALLSFQPTLLESKGSHDDTAVLSAAALASALISHQPLF